MSCALTLPLLLPFFSAAVLLLLGRFRRAQRIASVVSTLALLGASLFLLYRAHRHGIIAVQIGSIPAPFGITLVADLLSATMVVAAALMGALITIYSLSGIEESRATAGYFPLVLVTLLGANGAFLTGDLFNLYVWFEVTLLSSFALLSVGSGQETLPGAVKYVALNLVASMILLSAIGLLYGVTGTLCMADAARRMPGVAPAMSATIAGMFLVALGTKAAVFPLFFGLVAAYPGANVATVALFSALLAKMSVYALIRLFTLVLVGLMPAFASLLLWIGGLTMVTGVLGAAVKYELRKILSFHIVSQVGYMVMGLGLFTKGALAGTICFIVHNMLVKSSLFLVSGIVARKGGTTELRRLGGLFRSSPVLTVLFAIFAFSLAGVPPLSGFWGKLMLVQAALGSKEYALAATALAVSFFTLFSMTKILNEAFWKPRPEPESAPDGGAEDDRWPAGAKLGGGPLFFPVTVLAALTVLFGIAIGPLTNLFMEVARQLLRPEEYIRAVVGQIGG